MMRMAKGFRWRSLPSSLALLLLGASLVQVGDPRGGSIQILMGAKLEPLIVDIDNRDRVPSPDQGRSDSVQNLREGKPGPQTEDAADQEAAVGIWESFPDRRDGRIGCSRGGDQHNLAGARHRLKHLSMLGAV
jgi:hypothetical protein